MPSPRRKLTRLSPQWALVSRGNARALLASERRLLASSLGAVSRATDSLLLTTSFLSSAKSLKIAVLSASQRIAEQLRGDLSSAILAGRRDARSSALTRLARELREVASELRLAEAIATPPSSDAAEDISLAQASADSYAAAWRAAVAAAVLRWAEAPESELSARIRVAVRQQQHRIERIAATETPRAYNDEHDEGVGWVAERYADARWLPLVAKRWDGILDRKICPVCRERDGDYVPVGFKWDGVEPGEPHPRCRCMDSIVVLPARLRGEVVPGYQVDDERPRDAA